MRAFVLVVLAGCAEEKPVITGTVDVFSTSSLSEYPYLAIRLLSEGSFFFDYAHDVPAPTTWPAQFGAGDQESSGPRILRVWLAREPSELNPTQGAPWGETDVTLSCSSDGECEPVTGIEVTLIPRS